MKGKNRLETAEGDQDNLPLIAQLASIRESGNSREDEFSADQENSYSKQEMAMSPSTAYSYQPSSLYSATSEGGPSSMHLSHLRQQQLFQQQMMVAARSQTSPRRQRRFKSRPSSSSSLLGKEKYRDGYQSSNSVSGAGSSSASSSHSAPSSSASSSSGTSGSNPISRLSKISESETLVNGISRVRSNRSISSDDDNIPLAHRLQQIRVSSSTERPVIRGSIETPPKKKKGFWKKFLQFFSGSKRKGKREIVVDAARSNNSQIEIGYNRQSPRSSSLTSSSRQSERRPIDDSDDIQVLAQPENSSHPLRPNNSFRTLNSQSSTVAPNPFEASLPDLDIGLEFEDIIAKYGNQSY